MTDAELIRGLQAGDTALLPVLYERCLAPVWRYAYRRLNGDSHGARDIASETFLAAIESLPRMSVNKGTLLGWLLRIARNKISRRWRQNERLEDPSILAEVAAAHTDNPQALLEAVEQTERILAALEGLDDHQRTALEWKYLDDCSVHEIATRLGRSEKAIEGLLYRARQSFQARYGPL
jgi:RNA polymerase sigma-70 factor (ECF subfamily)